MKKYLPYILYAIIAGLIMRPFFAPGFLFLLDMVWAPGLDLTDRLANGISSGFPFILVFKALSFVFPLEFIQKTLLLGIFFLMGISMYCFARSRNLGAKWAIISGLFYMLNPWVYERFLAGHWYVMLGYAVFPLAVQLFLAFLKSPLKKNFWKLTILLAFYPILSPHWAYIACLFLLFSGFIFLVFKKQLAIILSWRFWANFAKAVLFWLAVNAFWLFSFLGGKGVYHKITLNDFEAFKTAADSGFGAFFNVASLYGYWQSVYFLPKDFFPWWWLMSIIVLMFSAYGLVSLLYKKNYFGIISVLAIPLVLILAVGFANPFTKQITTGLFYVLPGFKGLRETEKLGGVLAFFLAFLFPLGIKGFGQYAFESLNIAKEKIIKNFLFVFSILLIVFISFGMFTGFNSQLRPYEYPKDWYLANKLLKANNSVKTVLVLPWHGYPRLNFAGYKKIANPANTFFDFPVVQGRNLDNVFLLETEQGSWDRLMLRLVHKMETIEENLEFLKNNNISHIILLKIHDWDRYEFLEDSTVLKKMFAGEDVLIYQIER